MNTQYIIYCTTNKINGKKYIGSHTCHNKCQYLKKGQDQCGYLGSGVVLKSAIEKYGSHNFERKNLIEGIDEKGMHHIEEMLLKHFDASNRSDFYNIKNEAVGAGSGDDNPRYWQGKKRPDMQGDNNPNFWLGKKRPDMQGDNNPRYWQGKKRPDLSEKIRKITDDQVDAVLVSRFRDRKSWSELCRIYGSTIGETKLRNIIYPFSKIYVEERKSYEEKYGKF